jgi:hypothetical protein
MKVSKYAVLLCLSLVSVAIFAGEKPAKQDKPSLSSSETMRVNALVESVDYETREIVLRDPGNELITITAGDEVVNLQQMKPGDIVNAEYTENLYIDVFENQGSKPSESEFTAMGTAEKGQKPGLTSFDSHVVTATVEAINIEANTFKLKWPDESVEEFVAQNPKNLKKTKVGDLVVITRTNSLSISVEETDR